MRSSRPMRAYEGRSRALVAQKGPRPIVVRNSDLAVSPPRRLPLTLKARRSFAKLTWYTILALIFAIIGYAYHDPDMRKAVDYQMTMLVSPGVSSVSPTYFDYEKVSEPLPARAAYLFADSQKGPRADRFAYALKAAGNDIVARRMKADPLHLQNGASAEQQPAIQTAAAAGASLFLSAFGPESSSEAEIDTRPPSSAGSQWAGLLKNASLSPEQPKTLFGGLTEDEFRARELRCMATAIYFAARDEPIRGQLAVAQVIMNRIRSSRSRSSLARCGSTRSGTRRIITRPMFIPRGGASSTKLRKLEAISSTR
jgi:hypothetical protein